MVTLKSNSNVIAPLPVGPSTLAMATFTPSVRTVESTYEMRLIKELRKKIMLGLSVNKYYNYQDTTNLLSLRS
ncbi:MAG: hypothetical protein NVSMB24_12760 [Mucilaginibacter sp.]